MRSIWFRRAASSVFIMALLPVAAYAQNEIALREQAAQTVAASFLRQLSGELMREMSNGPAQAATVCRDIAPELAGMLSRQNGWQVTRIGTRVRNPLLGLPDAWESKVLGDFEKRVAAGEDIAAMSFGELVDNGASQEYRYLKAIGVQAPCLVCHGSSEQIPGNVKDSLAQFYPRDRAVDYALGQLRGAISIRQPMDIPLLGE